jgi:hypothetical protein
MGGPLSTRVSNEDGTAVELADHLTLEHKKGTRGFTNEYLENLHKTLHTRRRDPLPEHRHPELPQQRRPLDDEPVAV